MPSDSRIWASRSGSALRPRGENAFAGSPGITRNRKKLMTTTNASVASAASVLRSTSSGVIGQGRRAGAPPRGRSGRSGRGDTVPVVGVDTLLPFVGRRSAPHREHGEGDAAEGEDANGHTEHDQQPAAAAFGGLLPHRFDVAVAVCAVLEHERTTVGRLRLESGELVAPVRLEV